MALEVKHDNSLMLMFLNISYMVLITCKKCGELDYYTSKAFWNITDLGVKCTNCNTLNTITLENGELRKQVQFLIEVWKRTKILQSDLNIYLMTFILCKKCGDQLYLPDSYGDVTDFDVTCTASCRAVNVVTTKDGKIKGQYLRDIQSKSIYVVI